MSFSALTSVALSREHDDWTIRAHTDVDACSLPRLQLKRSLYIHLVPIACEARRGDATTISTASATAITTTTTTPPLPLWLWQGLRGLLPITGPMIYYRGNDTTGTTSIRQQHHPHHKSSIISQSSIIQHPSFPKAPWGVMGCQNHLF